MLVLVLGLILLYWFKRRDGWLIAALAIGGVSLVVPAAARWVHWGWSRLSLLMGEISGRLLLTLVYILLLLPLSLLARWFGRSGIRRSPGGNSYFADRSHSFDKEDLMHPW